MAPPQCAPRVPSRWDVPKVNTTEDVDLKSNDGDILESATSSFDVSSAALNVVSAKAVIMNPEHVLPSRESATTENTFGSERLEPSHHPQDLRAKQLLNGRAAPGHERPCSQWPSVVALLKKNGRRMTTRHIEPHVSKPSLRGGDFNESAMKCVCVDHLKGWSWLLVGGLGSVC